MKIGNKGLRFALLAMAIVSCTPLGLATPTRTTIPTATLPSVRPSPAPFLSEYSFPESIDLTKQYLFYLHGKIIEDQGIPAVSPQYGKYEYQAILEKLNSYGFIVISEHRAKNTDGVVYAKRVTEQVTALLKAGVPAKNITVVGASKGAWITAHASHLLGNEDLHFVILAICHPDVVDTFIQDQIYLHGDILSVYDSVDEYAGSCQEYFSFSEGKGISQYDEIVLKKILPKSWDYLGMIASKKKKTEIFDHLLAEGADPAILDKVSSPIGLEIGSKTPAEIAVSIMAEMIKVYRSGDL